MYTRRTGEEGNVQRNDGVMECDGTRDDAMETKMDTKIDPKVENRIEEKAKSKCHHFEREGGREWLWSLCEKQS